MLFDRILTLKLNILGILLKFNLELLLWIMCVLVYCVSHAFAFVHCCLVVTCWERADLLALVGDVYYIFLLSHVVSWVRCGTRLYHFLTFAVFFTLSIKELNS